VTLLPPAGHPSTGARRAAGPSFAVGLEAHGAAVAVVADGTTVSYVELAARVDGRADELAGATAGTRRLVLLEAMNDLETLVTYLACLREGHVVLLVPPAAGGRTRDLVDRYEPDVIAGAGSAGTWTIEERHPSSRHELHPDLALLLSTSGSTGAPKLVRLSPDNLDANARAIATYLGLRDDDRAITSLPMAYCYGLSVINSHLAVGASVVLTDRSVIDAEFWRACATHGATSLAGVPHTFELLDRIGFADLHLPALRRVTQAGGRLHPDLVRRYADLGRRRGWDLFVMYGQTEATARMAYLPPSLAARHPSAIGVAIPGGFLRLVDVDDAGIGELVYRGPNVMLGYAESTSDLALGRTVDELRTGDLARVDEAGLFEIVGRRRRFVKPFGLRVDLDQLERVLREAGVEALCTGDDRGLAVATVAADVARAAAVVHERTGLPAAAVAVHAVESLPRLANGKPDHAAVRALGGRRAPASAPTRLGPVGRLYADVFSRTDLGDDDTFISLGGDSLSYVELSVRLEEVLHDLPEDWPARRLADLEQLVPSPARPADPAAADDDGPTPRRRRLVAAVETSVVLRAAAIVLIVSTHIALVDLKGGAHLLLAVAGWNFARFQLPVVGRRLATSVARVAVPTIAWTALLLLATDAYDLTNLFLVHTQLGEATSWDQRWRFWFIETLVQALLVIGAVLSVPAVRRLERRRPFEVSLVALAAALVLREVARHDGTVRRPQEVLWFFVLGWVVQRARTTPHKLLVTALTAGTVHGFFDQPGRELVVFLGISALVWLRSIPMVRPLHRATAAVAASSLAVYLTHWHVYPTVREWSSPAVAVAASFAVGLALHAVGRRGASALRRLR